MVDAKQRRRIQDRRRKGRSKRFPGRERTRRRSGVGLGRFRDGRGQGFVKVGEGFGQRLAAVQTA